MKKIIPYLISIVLGIAIAVYLFIIWQPLKDKDITKNQYEINVLFKI